MFGSSFWAQSLQLQAFAEAQKDCAQPEEALMEHRRPIELSEREGELIELASHGHTDASIANVLGISEATVSTYWGRIRIKVGPFSRPEIIATVIRQHADEQIADLQHQNEALVEKLKTEPTPAKESNSQSSDYLKLLESVPDAILVVDAAGTIEAADDDLCSLFGYEHGELDGENLQLLIPERFRREHRIHRSEFMEVPSKRKMAVHSVAVGRRKDGTEFQIVASLTPVDCPTGPMVICIVRPAIRRIKQRI